MPGPPALDEWDRRTRGLQIDLARDRRALVDIARRFLVERGDQALGLGPARILPPEKADTWILFWTAARRVDDFQESGRRSVKEWRRSLDEGTEVTFAERCLGAFLRSPGGIGTRRELTALLHRGLDGLEGERRFRQPQPILDYLDLIQDKSATAMWILDRLLFPAEKPTLLERHAALFAASTQIGDDCRDVRHDLPLGRCFLTLEELEDQPSIQAYLASPDFPAIRTEMCRRTLVAADHVASDFESPDHGRLAQLLSGLWWYAIRTGQIRPRRARLRLPERGADGGTRALKKTQLPPKIAAALRRRLRA